MSEDPLDIKRLHRGIVRRLRHARFSLSQCDGREFITVNLLGRGAVGSKFRRDLVRPLKSSSQVEMSLPVAQMTSLLGTPNAQRSRHPNT